jgi:hypothetical protein
LRKARLRPARFGGGSDVAPGGRAWIEVNGSKRADPYRGQMPVQLLLCAQELTARAMVSAGEWEKPARRSGPADRADDRSRAFDAAERC